MCTLYVTLKLAKKCHFRVYNFKILTRWINSKVKFGFYTKKKLDMIPSLLATIRTPMFLDLCYFSSKLLKFLQNLFFFKKIIFLC